MYFAITFSIDCFQISMDIKVLSSILGHAQASTTLNLYAHALPDHKKAGMADDYAKGCSPPRAFSGISHYGRHNPAIPNVPGLPSDMSIVKTSRGADPTSLCPRRVHPQHCATLQPTGRVHPVSNPESRTPPIPHKITGHQQGDA